MTARTVVSDGSIEAAPVTPDGVTGYVSKRPHDRPLPPLDESFDLADFLPAPEVEKIGRDLIASCGEFSHLRKDFTIEFAWKRKGGRSQGRDVYGKCNKLGGPARYFAGVDWFIWVAADHIRDAAFSNLQLEALVFHELMHIGATLDEDVNSPTYNQFVLSLKGHDHEVFGAELTRYGAWNSSRRTLIEIAKQVPLTLS